MNGRIHTALQPKVFASVDAASEECKAASFFFRRHLIMATLLAPFIARAAPGVDATTQIDPALPAYQPRMKVAGELVCSGADTMRDLLSAWAQAFEHYHAFARIRVDRDTTLSAQGFDALMAGRADVVSFVREPFAAELDAFKQKFGYTLGLVNVAGGSYATRSGTHALAIYVNAANPLTQIDLTQLDAIYSRERRRSTFAPITTWGPLGLHGEWAQRPIHAYGMLSHRASGNPPGIVNFLKDRVLLGGEFRDDIQEQTDHPGETALDAIVHRVAEDPNGIGYSGFGYAAKGAKTLALAESVAGPYYAGSPAQVARRNYPLSRQIYLGFNHAPGQPFPPILQEFIAFVLTRHGQQIVAKDRMHFIPLSAAQSYLARRGFNRDP